MSGEPVIRSLSSAANSKGYERKVVPFQRSTDSNGPDCVFQLDTVTIGLLTIEESRPSDSSTDVTMLVIFHTSS